MLGEWDSTRSQHPSNQLGDFHTEMQNEPPKLPCRDWEWVYKHLVCEFTHWDFCLTGLVLFEGSYWYCTVEAGNETYLLQRVNWTDRCAEYLKDYENTYHHWFYYGGKRGTYDGRDLKVLTEKWGDCDPISDQFKGEEE